MDNQGLLDGMAKIARSAGAAILEVYEQADHQVQSKEDDSPLTAADLAAHRIILQALEALAPDIPVLSEESEHIAFEERASWSEYFLVDPLDGTKEFINRNGEFTVNIALIRQHQPVLGVVFVPVQNKLYSGDTGRGEAWLQHGESLTAIETRQVTDQKISIVASRRHGGEALVSLMDKLGESCEVDTLSVGSSLKFCMIAEGRADLYPRFAPTSEWDTGAAQAVVVAAGGQVVNLGFEPLGYNQKADILNPHFVVFGDPTFPWKDIIQSVT